MNSIIQTGNGQISTGGNSPNTKRGDVVNNCNKKEKFGWFSTGLVFPIIAAVVAEWINQGVVSNIFNLIFKLCAKLGNVFFN